MDGQGRLLMPQLLRDAAQIKGEVAVWATRQYLEVRNLRGLPEADSGRQVHA
jgi:DNA-binding transcriptional regulator/RsmH inhibitor MraZ